MSYFLGVDAGGSKTKAVIINDSSETIAEYNGGPGNYHNIGLTEAVTNVMATVTHVLDKAHLTFSDISWVTIGAAGCNTKRDYQRLSEAFTSGPMGKVANRLTIKNDTKISLYSGTLPPGLVVQCGTGCNVYGKNDHGEGAMAGNWGHFLGDKGSGYALAKRFFESVVEAYDHIGEATLLTKKLEEKLNIKNPQDIVNWYNDTRPSVHQISDFAPLVLSAAEEGDQKAKELVDEAIAHLGRALIAVVKKLKMEEEYNRVVIAGGLFESKYFRAVFEGHVTALLKRVRIVKPLVSPAVGAALMAKAEWEKNRSSTP